MTSGAAPDTVSKHHRQHLLPMRPTRVTLFTVDTNADTLSPFSLASSKNELGTTRTRYPQLRRPLLTRTAELLHAAMKGPANHGGTFFFCKTRANNSTIAVLSSAVESWDPHERNPGRPDFRANLWFEVSRKCQILIFRIARSQGTHKSHRTGLFLISDELSERAISKNSCRMDTACR